MANSVYLWNVVDWLSVTDFDTALADPAYTDPYGALSHPTLALCEFQIIFPRSKTNKKEEPLVEGNFVEAVAGRQEMYNIIAGVSTRRRLQAGESTRRRLIAGPSSKDMGITEPAFERSAFLIATLWRR